MAHVALTMTALGSEGPCQACRRPFERGETMYAIEAGDGDPLGWICDACRLEWIANSNQGATARALAAPAKETP